MQLEASPICKKYAKCIRSEWPDLAITLAHDVERYQWVCWIRANGKLTGVSISGESRYPEMALRHALEAYCFIRNIHEEE